MECETDASIFSLVFSKGAFAVLCRASAVSPERERAAQRPLSLFALLMTSHLLLGLIRSLLTVKGSFLFHLESPNIHTTPTYTYNSLAVCAIIIVSITLVDIYLLRICWSADTTPSCWIDSFAD